MSIPVQNIYHLMVYAWDQLDAAGQVAVTAEPEDGLLDLLARVMIAGTTALLKRGLSREYVQTEELSGRIRGRVMLTKSIRENTFIHAKAWCAADELSHDTIPNRILKGTLFLLLANRDLNKEILRQVRLLYQRLADVTLYPKWNPHEIEQIHLSRINSHYGLLLNVCQLIHEQAMLTEQKGERLFQDFVRDKKRMARLFERFVYQFYKRKLPGFAVKAKQLRWGLAASDQASADALPVMQTDIVLSASDRKIIIDCKYYRRALISRHNRDRINSAHLYQVYAYLQHAQTGTLSVPTDAVLLYPVTEEAYRFCYQEQGTPNRIRIETVNLNQPWRQVEDELLGIANFL